MMSAVVYSEYTDTYQSSIANVVSRMVWHNFEDSSSGFYDLKSKILVLKSATLRRVILTLLYTWGGGGSQLGHMGSLCNPDQKKVHQKSSYV